MTGVLSIVASLPRKRAFQGQHTVASRLKNRNGKTTLLTKNLLQGHFQGPSDRKYACLICSVPPHCGYIGSWMPPQLHRSLTIPGPAGRLEAILWSTSDDGGITPPLAAIVCHPHPLFGGTMHNKVVYHTAKTIHRFGLPVVRFNFRGVGLSEGTHDNGVGEKDDVSAVIGFLSAEAPGLPLLLAGFSFGAWVGLRAGCEDPRVAEMIGLGLPVGSFDSRDFSYLNDCDKPKLLVCGEFDPYGPPNLLRPMVEKFPASVSQKTQVAVVEGGDHFFTGHLSDLERTLAEWLVARHPELAARELRE